MPAKTKLEQLKGNVEAQESRLEEGMKMLLEAKSKPRTPEAEENGYNPEWDALERVIGLMDDLIASYRTYSVELEKRVKWLGSRTASGKDD